VFVLAIVFVEPWKRRRLTQAFERKVQELEATNLDAVTKGMNALQNRLEEQQDKVLAGLAGVTSTLSTLLVREREESVVEGMPPALAFAGINLTNHDVKLIAASVTTGILAWAIRGWVGY